MMQLIVLGQIPGTHVQLTYGWFQLVLLPLVIFVGYKMYRLQAQKSAQRQQRHFDFISLRSLDQA